MALVGLGAAADSHSTKHCFVRQKLPWGLQVPSRASYLGIRDPASADPFRPRGLKLPWAQHLEASMRRFSYRPLTGEIHYLLGLV